MVKGKKWQDDIRGFKLEQSNSIIQAGLTNYTALYLIPHKVAMQPGATRGSSTLSKDTQQLKNSVISEKPALPADTPSPMSTLKVNSVHKFGAESQGAHLSSCVVTTKTDPYHQEDYIQRNQRK